MSSPAADPLLGQQIEGYRIIRSVGHGGMGMIYEAVHTGIGQRAAVKVLFPAYSRDEEAVSRFVAEARAASRVRHPGLVKIFNHGRLADGTAYIMMEYLDGESLQAHLLRLHRQSETMPLADVRRIAGQVASALAAVHREGIVHRDLKPANLLSFADPEASGGERIKVVDFGIAKFVSGSPSEVGKTTVGRFLGTALYASPEQCQMAGQVGPMADVYALGVILYEMLVGRPPFWAEHPGAVIAMHLSRRPRPLWEIRKALPTPLCQLIHEMLSKEPERRPSMEQIGARLNALRLDAAEWPFQLWRHKGAAAAVLCGVLLAGGLFRLQVHDRMRKAGHSKAEAPSPPAALHAPLPPRWTAARDLAVLQPPAAPTPAVFFPQLAAGSRAASHGLSSLRDSARGRAQGKPAAAGRKKLVASAGGSVGLSANLADDTVPPPRASAEPAPADDAASGSPAAAAAAQAAPQTRAPKPGPDRKEDRKEERDEDEAFH